MFTWDEDKNTANSIKHGLVFEEVYDFDWEDSIIVDRSRLSIDKEKRFAAIGKLRGKIHTIIYTPRNGNTRIISLRRANKGEEALYAKKNN